MPTDDELGFHYSRERRLASADPAVRELNREGPRKKPGLFRTLTATRPLAFLFLAIIMLAATALVVEYALPALRRPTLEGLEFSASAFRYEGSTFIVVRKRAAGKAPYRGDFFVAAAPAGAEAGKTVLKGFRADEETEQEFRFSIAGEHRKLAVVVEVQGAKAAFAVEAD